VFSIGRLGVATGADYYLERVANSVDDYYLGHGEAPGQWIGSMSASLGLTGEVDPAALRNLLDGRAADGTDLGIVRREKRRPGYDLTFSAPKSVSLLWTFGSPDVRDTISSAHDRAVAGVIDHLSREACVVRRGANGKDTYAGSGFLAAAFRHRTSRAGDPQVHTHVLVPNVVFGEDGCWSAPDGRQLYRWQKAASALYQSALRAELSCLGLAWEVRRSGLGEVSGVPQEILRAFSKRRVEVEKALAERGLDSARAAEVATLSTRSAKPEVTRSTETLRAGWEDELAAVAVPDDNDGFRPAGVDDVLGVVDNHRTRDAEVDTEAIFAVLAGEHGVAVSDYDLDAASSARAVPLTLLASTFSRRDALWAVAKAFDATTAEVVALTDELLARASVVRVLSGPGADMEQVRTRSGTLPAASPGDRRYSTMEMLSVERRISESARLRIGTGSGQVSAEGVARALHSSPHLDLEQRLGVEMLLSSGNGLDVVIGQAGTGKSTMLGAARVGWEAEGYEVIGVAVASRTAAALEASTGIRSSTMARLLMHLGASGHVGLGARHVIVVEEASMVGSRSLDLVQRYADAAGAKVVLVGDNRQLSSIDAGGALRTLSRELGTQVVELTTNRRQAGVDQAWEREALGRLRNGDIAPAVAAYVEHGRLSFAEDAHMARAQLIEAWWAVHEQSTAILAVTRSDVAALNDLARRRRSAAGELGPELRLASGKAFSVGDRVLFEKNERVVAVRGAVGAEGSTLQIRNGTFGTVVTLTPPISESLTREGDVPAIARAEGDVRGHDQVLVVDLDAGGRVALPEHYVEESTSLGYALTVFRAQGVTVDHAFVLGNEGLFQEAAYTAMSRGRLTNHLYATTADELRSEIGHEVRDERRDAMASLVTSLSATKEQTMALDHLRDRHPAGAALSTPGQHSTVADQLAASGDLHARSPEIAPDSPGVAAELSSLGDKLDGLQKSLEDLEDSLDRYERSTRTRSAPAWDYDSYDRDVGLDDGFGL
jgi:conjugative relaxase-like TrwC/TraI family protein